MTKEELIETRRILVKRQGELQNQKRLLAKSITTYREYIIKYKEEISAKNLNLDIFVCYTPDSPAQQAQANLGFYKNGIKVLRERSMEISNYLKRTSHYLSKIEKELGYNEQHL